MSFTTISNMLVLIILTSYILLSDSFFKRFTLKSNLNTGDFARNPIVALQSNTQLAATLSSQPTKGLKGRIISLSDLPKNLKLVKNITSLGNPKVIPPGGLGSDWLLWHHVRDDSIDNSTLKLSTGRILFATSPNGISNWKYHSDNPCFGPSKESGDWFLFDSEHVGVGDVVEPGQVAQSKFKTQEGVLLMYIFGGNGEVKTVVNATETTPAKLVKGSKMEIGVAVSQDGAHWSRVEGPSPHGAVLTVGNSDEFDSSFVAYPSVVEDKDEYKMFYQTYNEKTKKFTVGLAVARDGLLNWVKKGPVLTGSDDINDFDFNGITRRFVGEMEDKTFQMWYEGVSSQNIHSIGIATSTNGYNWKKVNNGKPIFERSANESDWDSGGVGSPHLVWLPTERKWRMYYVGMNSTSKDTTAAIGVAESTDADGRKFVRVSNCH